MNLEIVYIPTSLWLACASVITVLAVIFGYVYTHTKRSKQSTEIVTPSASPGTPKTKSTGDSDSMKETDEAVEDSTTEDGSKEHFETGKWPTDDATGECPSNAVPDPLRFCEHIQSEVKKAEHKYAAKKLQEGMTTQQIAEERSIQQQQLAAIFQMMEEDSDKFGIASMGDMKEQMKLYM